MARKEHGHRRSAEYGGDATPTYRTWRAMKHRSRAGDEYSRYKDYKGRGIDLAPEWFDFATFLADMGEKPSPNHSIERVDNSKGYGPGNCVWADARTQANNRRSNKRFEFRGQTFTQAELCRHMGVTQNMVRHRLRNGWSIEDAVTTPSGQGLKDERGHFIPHPRSGSSLS